MGQDFNYHRVIVGSRIQVLQAIVDSNGAICCCDDGWCNELTATVAFWSPCDCVSGGGGGGLVLVAMVVVQRIYNPPTSYVF